MISADAMKASKRSAVESLLDHISKNITTTEKTKSWWNKTVTAEDMRYMGVKNWDCSIGLARLVYADLELLAAQTPETWAQLPMAERIGLTNSFETAVHEMTHGCGPRAMFSGDYVGTGQWLEEAVTSAASRGKAPEVFKAVMGFDSGFSAETFSSVAYAKEQQQLAKVLGGPFYGKDLQVPMAGVNEQVLYDLAYRVKPGEGQWKYIGERVKQLYPDIQLSAEQIASQASLDPRFTIKEMEKAAKGRLKAETERVVGDAMGRAGHDANFAAQMRKPMENAMGAGGEAALQGLGVSISFDLTDPRVVAWMRGHLPELAGGVNDTTRQAIANALADGIAAGETTPALAERVAAVFEQADSFRADLIARTEEMQAQMRGHLEGWQQSGIVGGKEWDALDDACEECADMDGDFAALDEEFKNGQMIPDVHPNERCTVLPILSDEWEAMQKAAPAGRFKMRRVGGEIKYIPLEDTQ